MHRTMLKPYFLYHGTRSCVFHFYGTSQDTDNDSLKLFYLRAYREHNPMKWWYSSSLAYFLLLIRRCMRHPWTKIQKTRVCHCKGINCMN